MNDAKRSVLLYGLASAVISGSSFAVAPLLLALLGHDGFAQWSLLEPTLLILLPVAGLGIQSGLLYAVSTRPQTMATTTSGLLPFHVLICVPVGLLAGAAAIGMNASPSVAGLVAVAVAAEGGMSFFVSLWRAQTKPLPHLLLEGGRAALLAGILALCLVWPLPAEFTLQAYLVARVSLGCIALLFAVTYSRPGFSPNGTAAWHALRYGLPVVLASMLVAVLLSVDRFAVGDLSTLEVSTYIAHSRVAQLLLVAAAAFQIWYAPQAMKRLHRAAQEKFFSDAAKVSVAASAWLTANAWLIIPFIWHTVFPSVDLDRNLLLLLLLPMALLAVGNVVGIGAMKDGFTHHATLIALVAVCVAGLASFSLAGFLGSIGAALGKLVGLSVYFVTLAAQSNRVLKVGYNWPLYSAALACFSLALWLVGQLAPLGQWTTSLTVVLAVNVGFLVLFRSLRRPPKPSPL